MLGAYETAAKEATGTIDYSGGDPQGMIAFALACPTPGSGTVIARHEPEAQACTFRILVWPEAEEKHILTVRKTSSGKEAVGLGGYTSPVDKFGILFATSTRVTLKSLRVRKLAPGWTPQQDPSLTKYLQATSPENFKPYSK